MDSIELNIQGMFADAVGTDHGVTTQEWDAVAAAVVAGQEALFARRKAHQLGFADVPFNASQVETMLPVAQRVKYRFDTLVVLGIGGSSLGLRCLTEALLNPALTKDDHLDRRSVPQLHIFDNVDPDSFVPFLEQCDWSKTCVNVISKSGKTAETGAQYLIVQELLKRRLGSTKWKDHVVVTTDPASGPLRSMAICEGLQSFEVPHNVGGRFSCFTPVALFPAACAGVDIAEVLAGARAMAEACCAPKLAGNIAAELAAAHYLLDTKHGKSMSVMMPYVSALQRFTDWYVQLVAESLGKAGQGQTPIRALGATDQHAQLQLFTEGPNNKVVTMLTANHFACDVTIPNSDESAFAYLGGHQLSDLLNAEAAGTRQSLIEAGRPTLHLQIPQLTPHVLGQLLFCYQWHTALAAQLYDINAFDQPGVERSKQLTRELL